MNATQFVDSSITPINHLRGLPVQAVGKFSVATGKLGDARYPMPCP